MKYDICEECNGILKLIYEGLHEWYKCSRCKRIFLKSWTKEVSK